jgi:hypothetical protein
MEKDGAAAGKLAMFVALIPAGMAGTMLLVAIPALGKPLLAMAGFCIPAFCIPGAGGKPVLPKPAFPGRLFAATFICGA